MVVWHGINSYPSKIPLFFFRILAFSRIYEAPTVVIGNTTDRYDLLYTLKENGGLSEVKSQQNAWRSIVALVMAASSRFSYSWKIPLSTLKRHRGKQLLCEVYCLIFRICWWGSESVKPFPCSRSHSAEVRNHEGRDIERKVWLFYEVKCHRLKQVFPRIAYDWNTVRTWLYLFWW